MHVRTWGELKAEAAGLMGRERPVGLWASLGCSRDPPPPRPTSLVHGSARLPDKTVPRADPAATAPCWHQTPRCAQPGGHEHQLAPKSCRTKMVALTFKDTELPKPRTRCENDALRSRGMEKSPR